MLIKDQKYEAELKQKYGTDWKFSQEYKMWKGGWGKEVKNEQH